MNAFLAFAPHDENPESIDNHHKHACFADVYSVYIISAQIYLEASYISLRKQHGNAHELFIYAPPHLLVPYT